MHHFGMGDSMADADRLSPWWGRMVVITMVFGFAVLILLSVKAYTNAPPIPVRAVDPSGAVAYTGEDVTNGQAVFLKYGLMDNGSVWGHGAYLGPDFSAEYLHAMALDSAERSAQARFSKSYVDLSAEEKAVIEGEIQPLLRANRYDPATGDLTLAPGGAETFQHQVEHWRDYLRDPAGNGGLYANAITDPKELHDLTAFFAWAAWASVAQRPGTAHSFTNNFPYDALAGNRASGSAVIWSGISFIFLLGGTAIVLLAFGKFNYLGWHRRDGRQAAAVFPPPTPSQAATLKFMAIAALLFLMQTLVGGAVAHYRADPGTFYGIDLSVLFPSNLLRTWHLQTAIFWIATTYVAGALFVADMLGKPKPGESRPKGQRGAIHLLFGALVVVVVGSLLGEWAGILQWFPKTWFWIGDQGWEYLELGRLWQILLAIGLLFWFGLLWRAVAPARRDPERRTLAHFFLLAAFAVPVFYLPALFFNERTNYTIVDMWRFWIIHLWVEGFFEFFVTVIVAVIFHEMNLVARSTALRTIYLDAILYFGGGLIGTGHHWYWTGQTEFNMAVSAVFSALEVVPLTLLTLDAWDFVKVTDSLHRHRWTFRFLMAVGAWNFLGAGVFGFLVNTPIVSYYEVGTILTVNHGHAALMGVFGMLGAGLMTFVLREVAGDAAWSRLEKLVACAFWGLNIGLLMMVVLSLFPGGILQVNDVIQNGYWHARGLTYTAGSLPRFLEWMRLPGDLVFIVFGAVPLALAVCLGYWGSIRRKTAGNVHIARQAE
jgi:nitric oxide reductase subunit B